MATLRLSGVAATVVVMARPLSQIQEEIQSLSASDKESLLRSLLDAVARPANPDVDAAWLQEAQRRSREIDDGTVMCVPADDVFSRIEDSLKR